MVVQVMVEVVVVLTNGSRSSGRSGRRCRRAGRPHLASHMIRYSLFIIHYYHYH